MTAACEVDVFSCNSRFFVELHVRNFLSAEHNRVFKTKMKQYNQFVARTRLEEAVLHIAETDVDLIALLSDEANAVLVNFEVSKRLLADEVWPDNQVVECLLASGFEKD